ncbi:hypothetical protein DUI87_04989 [Hirundo rustica rustica]|uniref:Integrase-type domain-containing protein n=1 Tax=Hirundo rustica rustica TaxID=333673 RepID=A0A3M0L548_HIRRU|nr:hypothetical protein DUI87_04989 [Hirundo rustica rustica]
MVRNPETGKVEGPHDLVTWGRGYACVSTPTEPKWLPLKWAENIYDAIQKFRDMVGSIKKETNDRLDGLFFKLGNIGLVIISFSIIKRMLLKLISSTTHSPSDNWLAVPWAPDMAENMELEEVSEEGRNPDEEDLLKKIIKWGGPLNRSGFAELYPDSEYLPLLFQFSSS